MSLETIDKHEIFMSPSSQGARDVPMGHCVWEYNGASWSLKKNEAQNGGVPGTAPLEPGRFKGQLRATPCVTAS